MAVALNPTRLIFTGISFSSHGEAEAEAEAKVFCLFERSRAFYRYSSGGAGAFAVAWRKLGQRGFYHLRLQSAKFLWRCSALGDRVLLLHVPSAPLPTALASEK